MNEQSLINPELFNSILNIKKLTSDLETIYNQADIIRNTLTQSIQNYDDFLSQKDDIVKILDELQETLQITNVKLTDFCREVNDLGVELKHLEKNKDLKEKELKDIEKDKKEMLDEKDLIYNQMNYYKKQCLVKDEFIVELKSRINTLENDLRANNKNLISDNLDGKDNGVLEKYENYLNIVLPERVFNNSFSNLKDSKDGDKIKQEQIKNNSLNNNNNSINNNTINTNNKNNNTNNNNNNNNNNTNNNTNNNNNSIELYEPKLIFSNCMFLENTNKSKNLKASKHNKKTISDRLRKVVYEISLLDEISNDFLKTKYGMDIFEQISNGQINEEKLQYIENDLSSMNKFKSKTNNYNAKAKKNIENYCPYGWEVLKQYVNNYDKINV